MNKVELDLLFDIQEVIKVKISINSSCSNPNDFKLLGKAYHNCKYILPNLMDIQRDVILNSRNPDKIERYELSKQNIEYFEKLKVGIK